MKTKTKEKASEHLDERQLEQLVAGYSRRVVETWIELGRECALIWCCYGESMRFWSWYVRLEPEHPWLPLPGAADPLEQIDSEASWWDRPYADAARLGEPDNELADALDDARLGEPGSRWVGSTSMGTWRDVALAPGAPEYNLSGHAKMRARCVDLARIVELVARGS